jgi:hypothetical protein
MPIKCLTPAEKKMELHSVNEILDRIDWGHATISRSGPTERKLGVCN